MVLNVRLFYYYYYYYYYCYCYYYIYYYYTRFLLNALLLLVLLHNTIHYNTIQCIYTSVFASLSAPGHTQINVHKGWRVHITTGRKVVEEQNIWWHRGCQVDLRGHEEWRLQDLPCPQIQEELRSNHVSLAFQFTKFCPTLTFNYLLVVVETSHIKE